MTHCSPRAGAAASELRDAAVELARGAGAIIRDAYRLAPSGVDHKGAIDLVTDTDRAAEAHILAALGRRFPDHAIWAEESGRQAREGPYRWVIDPLDGTTNFASRIPHFGVLIAVQRRIEAGVEQPRERLERRVPDAYETVAGVVYDPMRDELFAAARGEGTTLDGRPVRVSSTTRLIDSVLATGFAYDRLWRADDNHAEFCRLNLITRGVRRLGAAGLDLAYVAAGRLDGFWESNLSAWDLAAGVLLVREAGGVVTGLDGGPFVLEAGAACCAGPALHPSLVAALASAAEHPIASRAGLEAHLPRELAERLREPD